MNFCYLKNEIKRKFYKPLKNNLFLHRIYKCHVSYLTIMVDKKLIDGKLLTWWISIIIFGTRNHENVYPVSLKTHCLQIMSLKKGNCRKEVLWRLSSHEFISFFFSPKDIYFANVLFFVTNLNISDQLRLILIS